MYSKCGMCLPKNPSSTMFGFYVPGKKALQKTTILLITVFLEDLFFQEKCTQGFIWIQTL